MSAKNIAGEKMGAFDKGMSGPSRELGGNRVSKVLIKTAAPTSGAPKKGAAGIGGKESKNTRAYKG